MDNIAFLLLSGQQYLLNKIDTIANNVANINTPGFRADQFLAIRQTVDMRNRSMYAMRNIDFPKDHATYKDITLGTARKTDKPLDIYIKGQAYFSIQDQHNNTLLTRSGRFTLSQDGYIVDMNGNALMSNINQKINIPIGGKVLINPDGKVIVNGNYIAMIKLTEFNNQQELRKVGDNYYVNHNAHNISRDQHSLLEQFYIEVSNVNGVRESTELIRAKTLFESLQQLIATDNKRKMSMISMIEQSAS